MVRTPSLDEELKRKMEKRLLLFFGSTFLLVSLWPQIFPPPPMPEDVSSPVVENRGSGLSTPADVPASPSEGGPTVRLEPEVRPEPSEESESEVRAAAEEREVVVETSLYRLVLSNRGGRLLSMRLREYLSNAREPYEMVGLGAAEYLNVRPLDLRLSSPRDTDAVSVALFETDAARKITVADGEEKTVSFRWSDGRRLAVEKHLTFLGATYRIHVEVSVTERGEEIGKQVLYGGGIGNEITESRYVGVDKGVVVSRGEVELFTTQDVDEGSGTGVSIMATGVASHYFTGLMLPADDALYASRFETGIVPTEDVKRPEREVITAALEAPTSRGVFTLYMGPKKLERLEALAPGMSQIIEFGSWMRYPALLLRSGLVRIYAFVGNWGFAIVLLTVAINIVLVPLKHYSFVSMRRMQKLAPQIQKIRDRYKKVKPTDPRYQQMNQEIMTLYKENNASPLSGCLPMLLMIPFFFAFYRLLMSSIELRQAPFIFWIQDLAVHDPMFVLPVLMGGTQMAIQKMTPQTSADPTQQKIMSFMPVMFTFILAWAPSGLVLYWFSNNLVSMAQQLMTNRFLGDREEKALKDGKAVKSVKKSKHKKSPKGEKQGA